MKKLLSLVLALLLALSFAGCFHRHDGKECNRYRGPSVFSVERF